MDNVLDYRQLLEVSWGGLRIHGFSMQSNSPSYFTRLRLDIDFPLRHWLGDDGIFRFELAPATVAFENVSRLHIEADSARFEPGYVVIKEVSHDLLEGDGATPYWTWTISGDWFEISFKTSAGSLVTRGEPLESSNAWLTPEEHGDVVFAAMPDDPS